MIDLSIIVPLYNTEKYIARCLDSLLDQDIPDDRFEIIVIDDGSKDNGKQVVEKYAKQYAQVRLFDQPNKGLSAARNRGLELARGNYLYFIDSDDFVAPNSFLKMIEFIKKHNLDIFGFGILPTKGSRLPAPNFTNTTFKDLTIYDGPGYIDTFNFRNEAVWYIIDRKFLNNINLVFTEGYMLADGIFTAELIYKARRITSIPSNIYGYFQRPGSALNTSSSARNRFLFRSYEWAALVFHDFYDKLNKEKRVHEEGLQRIEDKQRSYVFFLLIRVIKSDMSFSEINDLLNRLKSHKSYPIPSFFGTDFNRVTYRLLLPVLNSGILLFPSIFIYRILVKTVKYLKF
jgi:glycosyltransferase involved in cell wall biosynthesis